MGLARPRAVDGLSSSVGLEPRLLAVQQIYGVTVEKTSLDALAPPESLEPRDRSLATLISLTVLRNLRTIDQAVEACLSKPLPPGSGRLMANLRSLAGQILFTDLPNHAAVHNAVAIADRFDETARFRRLVNALGRKLSAQSDQFLVTHAEHELPNWMAKRWRASLGEGRFRATSARVRERPPLDLSFKSGAHMSRYASSFEMFGPITIDETTLRLTRSGPVPDLPGYEDGSWWVQDFSASLPAKWLLDEIGAPTGARILDACAAPGGKTAQLAAAGIDVTALDISAERLTRLETNLDRLHLNARVQPSDLLSFQTSELFDAVLLDAPCSATGTIRRHPDVVHVRTKKDILALAEQQSAFLVHTARLVRPEGLLVYATCSLEPEEGERQADTFLQEHTHFAPVAPSRAVKPYAMDDKPYLRTFPGYEPPDAAWAGMDGFFVACFRRTG